MLFEEFVWHHEQDLSFMFDPLKSDTLMGDSSLQVLVFHLYICSEAVPPWTLALLCLSKRMHSLFVLRLFNDCIAMLLAYAATALLVARWWAAALVAYSAAVSVKMNVLLLAPSVLVLLLKVGAWPTS